MSGHPAFRLTRSMARLAMASLLLLAGLVQAAHAERPLLRAEGQIDLKSPPDKVWDLIKDFDRIDRWHPNVKGTTLLEGTNNEPLAVRQLDLGDGQWLMSELLAWNAQERSFRYRILKSPLPFVNYVGTVRVEPSGSGGSRVIWVDEFRRRDENPKPGEDDAGVTEVVNGIIRSGLDNLPKVLKE